MVWDSSDLTDDWDALKFPAAKAESFQIRSLSNHVITVMIVLAQAMQVSSSTPACGAHGALQSSKASVQHEGRIDDNDARHYMFEAPLDVKLALGPMWRTSTCATARPYPCIFFA